MWCTRWFLPLLLLPLPTAPPFFLVLFILSLTVHAKPCFYCIVLLTTLFVSSCYWQPFPIDTPLTTPWSENISTFSEALNASLPLDYARPLPSVMRAVDRCWCDFSGSFFEPFNVAKWEYASVQRVSQELQRPSIPDPKITDTVPESDADDSELDSAKPQVDVLEAPTSFWTRLRRFNPPISRPTPTQMPRTQPPETATEPVLPPTWTDVPAPETEYDLRPYGLGVVLDFGWA